MLNRSFYTTKNQNGALLISLLMSISIISILMMISIPAYSKFKPNIDLSGAIDDLVSDLRYAQQLTLSEQVIYAIEIDIMNDRYDIICLADPTATTTIKTVSLPINTSFLNANGFTSNIIRFNSYGAVSEPGTIELTNTSGTNKLINVKPSGYVQSN